MGISIFDTFGGIKDNKCARFEFVFDYIKILDLEESISKMRWSFNGYLYLLFFADAIT
ncbi:hypothetical protein RGQ29_017739 [Quercus rubra]|uniref:Uncharacterized protein n=1 Tax=Quercus rubra TaxID=3512 RepID=A0AAN7FH44_QUERU|nr:hypothetical protein RGQ29_017739 [Quercus rubra]